MNDTATQTDATKGNAAAQPAHIELRSIKHMPSMSEETECFTATVWINGKKEGEASNRGHGGSNDYHPYSLQEKLSDIAKTRPSERINVGSAMNPTWFDFQPDADTVIGEILSAELQRKALKRLCSKKTLFRKAGVEYHEGEYSTVKSPFNEKVKAWILAKYPNATILNESI